MHYRTLQCITHTFFTQKTILEVQCVLCIGTQKFGIFFINFARSRKPITNLLLSQKHIDSHLDQGFLFLVCFVMICLVKSIPNSIIYSILNPKCEICESILLMGYIVTEYPPFLLLGTRGLNILLFYYWAPGVTNDTNRCSFC